MSAWFPSIHEPSLAGGCCIERALQLARGATQSWSGGAGALGFYGLLWSTSKAPPQPGHCRFRRFECSWIKRNCWWAWPCELQVDGVVSIVATLGWWGMRESVWWKGCLVSFFLFFFLNIMQKREFCYTSTLTVIIFLQSAISLETEKTKHVLHWGLGPTLGKSWVLFDTSRRQMGYPWHSYGVSRVLFHSVAMYRITWWFYDVPWIFGDDNYSWNMLPAEVANVLQFWSPSCYTLRPFFFAGLHPAIAWARRSARVVQRREGWAQFSGLRQFSRSKDPWLEIWSLVQDLVMKRWIYPHISTQKKPFGCQVKYPMTRWVAYIMYLDMIFPSYTNS